MDENDEWALGEFLQKCQLGSLFEVFKEHHISLGELQPLIEDETLFASVVPLVGQRLRLKKHWNLQQLALEAQINSQNQSFAFPSPGPSIDSTSDKCTSSYSPSSLTQSDSILFLGHPVSTTTPSNNVNDIIKAEIVFDDHDIVEQMQDSSPPKKRRLRDTSDVKSRQHCEKLLVDFNLKELLSKTVIGKAVTASYNKSGLSSQSQGYLTSIIINYFFDADINVHLTNSILSQVADRIVEFFPKECKELYYSPPVPKKYSKNKKTGVARGKLVDKNRNMLQFLKRCHLISKRNVGSDDEGGSGDKFDLDIATNSANWLKNNHQPFQPVLSHWKNSFKLRKKFSSLNTNSANTMASICSAWPILKSSTMGHLLIESDFEELYKDNANLLFQNWPTIFERILMVSKKKATNNILLELLEGGNLKKDSEDFIRFTLLFETISNKTFKLARKFGKLFWKPEVAEAQEGFILHVKDSGDIMNAIERKRLKMDTYGLTVQPYIIVVGPSITDIQSVHVSMDDILYTMPSLLKAVDVCFKTYIVFGLQYPLEAEHIWYLIQWGVYDVRLKSDQKLLQILQLLNVIKNTQETSLVPPS